MSSLARIKMVDESVNTRLTEASELLAKVDELSDGGVWVVVGALVWCFGAENVAEKGGVSHFLVGHELDEETVGSSQPGGLEIRHAEFGKTIVEQIELDVLLVQAQSLSMSVEKSQERSCQLTIDS